MEWRIIKKDGMDIKELLTRYDGSPIDIEQLSDYEQSIMKFFHDRKYIDNPHIQMTLQFDITEGDRVYRKAFATHPDASLTAYLTWRLLQTVNNYPALNYRHIDGQWYKFNNLPLFFNVARKDNTRLQDVVIENATKMNWPEFCSTYRNAVNNAMNSTTPFVPNPLYNLATVICNLPNIAFTQFGIHHLRTWLSRPAFYFGRRHRHNEKILIPLFVQLDHSNGDPTLLDMVLKEYEHLIKNVE
jgi:chloramphenicol O-acetyltransferase type A